MDSLYSGNSRYDYAEYAWSAIYSACAVARGERALGNAWLLVPTWIRVEKMKYLIHKEGRQLHRSCASRVGVRELCK